MSTLYVRYRPQTFEDIVGNESAIASLSKAINKKNHSHVYLLSGPPGTGKTTIARIMAKELGAEDMDIREINTSSARGIDTAREIIQQMRMLPMNGKAIVYILDECHKFTNDMQNALLKPLEDTPEFVYFFLCTTEPGKIIKAIKSRCTEIKLNSYSIEELVLIIKRVCKSENVTIGKTIIEEIAEISEGSPRKALVILEKILNCENEKDALEIIKNSSIDDEDPEIIELARALLNEKNTWSTIAKILKKLKEGNKLDEPETVRYIVLGYMSAVLLNGSMNKRAAIALESFSEPTYNTGKNGIILAAFNTIC